MGDVKISLRKRGVSDFLTTGDRLLPVTKPEYVLGLLGPDGKLADQYAPATALEGANYIGIADLNEVGTISIGDLYASEFGSTVDPSTAGSYLKVTSAGNLENNTDPGDHSIFGPGDEGDITFPIHLEVGDYIILKSVNAGGECEWAIRNNSYEIATVVKYGVTKLYAGIDSVSDVLAATAGAMKTTYDLANSKEDAIGTKGSAFNKSFGSGAGQVSEGNHRHASFDRAAGNVGGNVISDITITNGVVTALSWVSIGSIAFLDNALSDIDDGMVLIDEQSLDAKKQGMEYYTTVSNADGGNHNAGDIVAVLEA